MTKRTLEMKRRATGSPSSLPTHGLKLCYTEISGLSVRILKGTPLIVSMLPETLLEHRAAFTGFVRSRLGDASLAEDLVQDCLLKALRAEHVPEDSEGVVTWFYRVLRHAIIDVQRRRHVRGQALEKLEIEMEMATHPDADDERRVCQCVMKLLPAMPTADAELLRRIDLEGESATEIAQATNQRVNTLNVRLLRARRRLRDQVQQVCRACATHGCLDCDCPP